MMPTRYIWLGIVLFGSLSADALRIAHNPFIPLTNKSSQSPVAVTAQMCFGGDNMRTVCFMIRDGVIATREQ